jgi:flagellar motor switch protein FliN/FliY
MSITVKKIALPEQQAQNSGNPLLNDRYLSLVDTIEVECQIRLGSLSMTIGELSQLKQGQLLALSQKTDEPVDILLNNQVIARGELMCSEDCFALQIIGLSDD